MPGSIKIDDGSGNYTILTNAGSLGSDKTITIPNETATLATTTATDLGGLVLLQSHTASSSSAFSLQNFVDTSVYSHYEIIQRNLIGSSDAASYYFYMLDSSNNPLTGTYTSSGFYASGNQASSGTYDNISSTNYSRIQGTFGTGTREGFNFVKHTFFPSTDTPNTVLEQSERLTHTGQQQTRIGTHIYNSATLATGLYYYPSTGNISSGDCYVYGVKK
jgi:hypothetical protein